MFGARGRFGFIYLVIVIAFACLLVRLSELQLINGSEYDKLAGSKLTMNLADKAPRGEITDRYGEMLVGNKASYSLALLKTDISDDELNGVIFKVLNMLDEEGKVFEDSLPIAPDNLQFTFGSDDERRKWIKESGHEKQLGGAENGVQALSVLASEVYHINSSYSQEDVRRIAGVRYEAEKRGFSPLSPFIIAEDVSVALVSKIKEAGDEFPCIAVTNSFVREYYNDGFASHILGRTGKMNEEEYKKYKERGYGYNDNIGKQGVEKLAEEYLRGVDGVKGSAEGTGSKVSLIDKTPAQPGSNVVLTIDMDLQRTLEDSLKSRIEKIRRSGGEKTGADANAGAGVVVDVKNGDILACASYPTYDLSDFKEMYSKLSEDNNKPLWNRAVSGTYTPGSTFKPLVAIAALETGNLKASEKIVDEGIYKFYEDYRPRCWIWSEYHTTHGSINVSGAIEKSCNYFFYEAGRRTGIDKIDEYGSLFGLGEYTGTGLPEEVKGYIASPESKKKVVKTVTEQGWYGADTLQAAIGQSIHSFTPLQIANYVATIANGGTRYKLNLIKSVRSGIDGSLIQDTVPQVEAQIDMNSANLNAVRLGMKNVVEEGSARAIFTGYPIQIGGKTGTAQVGTKVSNNALFAAFAPFDDPEIAVCIVIEHGVRGANAAYVAKEIFDEYFGLNDDAVSAFVELEDYGMNG